MTPHAVRQSVCKIVAEERSHLALGSARDEIRQWESRVFKSVVSKAHKATKRTQRVIENKITRHILLYIGDKCVISAVDSSGAIARKRSPLDYACPLSVLSSCRLKRSGPELFPPPILRMLNFFGWCKRFAFCYIRVCFLRLDMLHVCLIAV